MAQAESSGFTQDEYGRRKGGWGGGPKLGDRFEGQAQGGVVLC